MHGTRDDPCGLGFWVGGFPVPYGSAGQRHIGRVGNMSQKP